MDFCARCLRTGFEVLMDTGATFLHRVGQGDIFFLGKYLSPISAPFRHYYQVRNIVLSGQRRGSSKRKVLLELLRRFVVICASCLYDGAIVARWRYAFRGLGHGLRGIGGPLTSQK
jgi:rhamnosyltransferase